MPSHSEAEFEAAKSLYFDQEYHTALPRLKAIADTFPMANHFLGVMAQTGLGGQIEDAEEAARLYRLAADSGTATAAYNLGILYQSGLLGSDKMRHAHREYVRANRFGHPPAKDKIKEVQIHLTYGLSTDLPPELYHAKRRTLWDRLVGRR